MAMNFFEVDKMLFQALRNYRPEVICERTGCSYDHDSDSFSIAYWDHQYVVDCRNERIFKSGGDSQTDHEYLPVFLINYLQQMRPGEGGEQWLSVKDLPGGATFFRGPHEVPTHWIAEAFGNDLSLFIRQCSRLGGKRLEMADASFQFDPCSQIRVAILYWVGDEDFPPEAGFLLGNIGTGMLALDSVYALAVDVCFKLSRLS